MKYVKLIHPSWLSSRNGAHTVINSILDSQIQFKRSGLSISSLSLDDISPRPTNIESPQKGGISFRSRVKSFLKTLTKYSRLACDLMIYIVELRPSKQLVDIYNKSDHNADEIVFFHTIIPCYYFLRSNKKKQKVVLVCHTNGDNLKMYRIYFPMLEKSCIYKKMLGMEQYVLENVDRINFVSSISKNTFLQLHPEIDSNKVSFIYNGVKDEIKAVCNSKRQDMFEFCCVASITNRKGQQFIINALKHFEKGAVPNVHFTFVGDGPSREALEKEVKINSLDNYITFAGLSQNVDEYLINSDAFILPSVDEGLPMAIIEAMKAALPIISTPVGGIPEMIESGVNGLLIQPNEESVYELLRNINKYDWESMGRNARKTFEEKFEISRMIEGYINLLSFD